MKNKLISPKAALMCSTCLVILFFSFSLIGASWQQQIQSLVKNGAVLAVSESGELLYSLNPERSLVPASTLKVATSLAALEILGKDFRFPTDFFLDKAGNLYVKGYGDPFLVSEEFPLIVQQLKNKGLGKKSQPIQNIILDGSYFDPHLEIHGLAGSLNPYDAYNGPLIANFNTLNVIKNPDGSVRSAEPQTPVTEITAELARLAPRGKSRINVAMYRKQAPLYVGYLLKEFLKQAGISVLGKVQAGVVPQNAKKFLTYLNSRDLSEVLRAGLKYSQNLIMNQTFLIFGVAESGPPVTLSKAQEAFRKFLKNKVGLHNFYVEEGSGISRKNSFTANQMEVVLKKFFPHRELLPQKNGMLVKTGTLNGVSCLIGYFPSQKYGWVRFVILLNQTGANREKIAHLLMANLS